MKKIYFIAFFINLLAITTYSKEPIKVLIADAPLNYGLHTIKNILDEKTLKNFFIKSDITNQETSIWDYNQLLRKKVFQQIKIFNQETYLDNLDTLKILMNDEDNLDLSLSSKIYLYSKALLPSSYLQLTGTLWSIHSTHVANLVIRNLEEKIQLYNYPLVDFETKFNPNWLEQNFVIKKIENQFQNLHQIISKEKIEFVNISAGSSIQSVEKNLLNFMNPLDKIKLTSSVIQISKFITKTWSENLKKLILNNPNTIFIIAAGNESQWIDLQEFNSSKVKARNLLIVSATENNHLASYSNFSEHYVQVATKGEASANVLDNYSIKLKGTSTATPIITNAILKYSINNPKINKGELIELFLKNKTQKNNKLLNFVKEGLEFNANKDF